ncbi:transposase [Ancylomarina longa]|uniref:Transposase n=1 Tax=Ancylomarina longa TaxID=2487017 RepID=A0A434AWR9_9BACT|nr:transposase [Ancylomarina longa]RUT78850.1 transposase [Ancylomarina longa]
MKKFQNKYRIPSARAVWWNYSNEGLYFVTICTHGRLLSFGAIANQEMELSVIGKLAHQFWYEIPNHFPFAKLHAFVVMPNHIHGIIEISNIVETLHATSVPNEMDARSVPNEMDATSVPNEMYATSVHEEMYARSVRDGLFVGNAKNKKMASISPKCGSLASIIRSYKSAVTKEARKMNSDFEWQERFHDHIIRDDQEYHRIANYINDNPRKWEEDKYKP